MRLLPEMPKKPAASVSKVKLLPRAVPVASYRVSAPITAFAAAFDETVTLLIMVVMRFSFRQAISVVITDPPLIVNTLIMIFEINVSATDGPQTQRAPTTSFDSALR